MEPFDIERLFKPSPSAQGRRTWMRSFGKASLLNTLFNTSKYEPHQGKKEKERRLRQKARLSK